MNTTTFERNTRMMYDIITSPMKQHAFIARVTATIATIANMPESVARAYFAESQQKLSTIPAQNDTPLHLCHLSHPSFPVFWAFVHRRELIEHFALLMWIIRPHQSGGRNRMKEALFKANDVLRDFAHEYTLLVQASHPTTIDFVIGMKANGVSRVRAIELFSTAQFLPDHYTNCAFQKRLEMHHQLEAEMVALVKTVIIPGKDLYNLYLRFASREEVRPVLQTADWQPFAEINYGEVTFSYEPTGKLSPGEDLVQKVFSSVRIGLWPRFKKGDINLVTLRAAYPSSDTNSRNILQKVVAEKYKHLSDFVQERRRTHRQLLSIGVKIHTFTHLKQAKDLSDTGFHLLESEWVIVLPPVGNSAAARELLHNLEAYLNVPILGNSTVFQIQVCTPGRLTPERCAILGSAWYLGSDTIRRIAPNRLTADRGSTGSRPIIYDGGILDSNFDWCPDFTTPNTSFLKTKPHGRTDVLCCESIRDIENVNLIASLLTHEQYGGTLSYQASEFTHEMTQILRRYDLDHVLQTSWVVDTRKPNGTIETSSNLFDTAFAEMQHHALKEAREQAGKTRQSGLLFDVQQLLWYTRTQIEGGY